MPRWRFVLAALALCALMAACWVTLRMEQRQKVAVDRHYERQPAEEDSWQALARQLQPPGAPLPPPVAADVDGLEEAVLRLGRGDTLASLLTGFDLDRREVARAVAALRPHLDIRHLQIGQEIRVTYEKLVASGATPVLRGLAIRPEARRRVALERDDSGAWHVDEKVFDVVKRVLRVAAGIDDSLIASARSAGLPQGALADMLKAFAWDVSFQHDIKDGDRFAALAEEARTEDGRRVGSGRLLWAELTTEGGKHTYSVYRFQPKGGRDFFYTRQGESVVRALLRTPLDLARLTVSSTFGMRRHPLLGFTRMHTGVDFPAPPGTPVLAAGDGRVVQAGRNGGYGNWVEIRHAGVLATGYAHLLRIARGIRRGVRVHQSQVIGFVGSTGLSTGPHLHFELRRAGRPVNPLSEAHRSLRIRLAGFELARFRKVVSEIDRLRLGR